MIAGAEPCPAFGWVEAGADAEEGSGWGLDDLFVRTRDELMDVFLHGWRGSCH